MILTQEKIEEINNNFKSFLFKSQKGEVARNFLKNRSIDLDILKNYEVGFCPPDFSYPSPDKLYIDNKLWWLRGRYIVTIRDQHGRIVSFAGRVIPECAKYLYQSLKKQINEPLLYPMDNDINKLKESIIKWKDIKWINEKYSKKDVLFGLYEAKKSILEKGYAIIVEGYMDAISLWINGFKNTVAICGTAMSPIHLLLLRRYTDHIVFCLDADDGGTIGVKRALDNIDKYGIDLSYYNILLPKIKNKKIDPEDVLNSNNKNILKWALDEAGYRQNPKDKKREIKIDDDAIKLLYKIKER